MKKILTLALLAIMALGAQAQGKRILVTYFLWSNNTKTLAKGLYIINGKKFLVKR